MQRSPRKAGAVASVHYFICGSIFFRSFLDDTHVAADQKWVARIVDERRRGTGNEGRFSAKHMERREVLAAEPNFRSCHHPSSIYLHVRTTVLDP